LTREEIEERKEALRATISVPDILSRYGVKVRGNRCQGFCHDGKDYNMKVFKTGCRCFVCDKSMDIFDITMHFEYCDFWTAFELLGGTEKPSFTAIRKAKSAIKEREDRNIRQHKIDVELRRIRAYVTAYRNIIKTSEPYSDLWCYVQNKLPYQIYLLELQDEKR